MFERITAAFYRTKRAELQDEYAAMGPREGFALPHRMAVSRAGRKFVRLVLENYHQDRITASDVADFLGVRLKHLQAIESEVLPGVS